MAAQIPMSSSLGPMAVILLGGHLASGSSISGSTCRSALLLSMRLPSRTSHETFGHGERVCEKSRQINIGGYISGQDQK
jgi:hypothetical protein